MTTGPVNFMIEEGDYLAFNRMIVRRSRPRFLALIVVTVALVIFAFRWFEGPQSFADILGVSIGGAIGGLATYWLVTAVALKFSVRKNFRQHLLLREEMTFRANANGFTYSQPSGETRAGWDKLTMWNEDDRIVALQPVPNLAYIVPKRALAEGDLCNLRGWLMDSGLERKGKARK